MDFDGASINRLIEQASQQYRYGDHNGAIETLKQALSVDPDNGFLHSYLAFGLVKQKRLGAAMHEANIGLSLEPDSGYSHYMLAMLLRIKNELKKALVHINQATATDPENVTYLALLSAIQRAMGQNKQALATLEQALAMAPDDPEILSQFGDYWLSLNRLDKADYYFTEALRIEPQFDSALIGKGTVLLYQGDIEEAREHAIWALQQDANDYAALSLLTSIKARKNPVMGTWWRLNAWLVSGNDARTILLLLFAYLFFRTSALVLGDMGHESIASVISISWLAIVAYTWIGPTWFTKKLKAELSTVALNKNF